jgi:hypothetical protein
MKTRRKKGFLIAFTPLSRNSSTRDEGGCRMIVTVKP